jgi:hypothetical protein
MVGYDHGDGLSAALDAGFADIGPLRVWLDRQDQGRRPDGPTRAPRYEPQALKAAARRSPAATATLRYPGVCQRGFRFDWYAGIPMRRTTVKLPDDLDARLRHEAERQGVTIAEVTRSALEAHLGAGRRRVLGAAGAGRSGRADISARIEEIISAEADRSR